VFLQELLGTQKEAVQSAESCDSQLKDLEDWVMEYMGKVNAASSNSTVMRDLCNKSKDICREGEGALLSRL